MNKKTLCDYIQVFSPMLPNRRCQELIDRFEKDTNHHEVKRVDRGYSFVQLDVTAAWPGVDREIEQILSSCYHRYYEALDLGRAWPRQYLHEHLRMKRYLPDGRDGFPPHVDVTSQASCMRFCTAILYLNDPGGGGETVFPELAVAIPPLPGRLVMFPPLWMFPHAGLPPRTKPKYILHSYIGYPPAAN